MIICIIALLGLHLLTPYWWWVIVVPLVYGLLRAKNTGAALRVGMVSAGLVWGGFAAFQFWTTASIIAQRISAMMQLSAPVWLVILTGVLGMICGGLGAVSGYWGRIALESRP